MNSSCNTVRTMVLQLSCSFMISFLSSQDLDDDKICIFGFSRGGYTARALAGMIHKVGLLPRGNNRHVNFVCRPPSHYYLPFLTRSSMHMMFSCKRVGMA